MLKLNVESLSEIAKTSLNPLYFRALESKEQNPIVKDEKAAAIVEKINFNFSWLDKIHADRVLQMMRCREFDRCTQTFLTENPSGVVVEIGCGFEDRLSRVDNGKVDWYNLDLPEVMTIRAKVMEENGRGKSISCSLLDSSWIKQLQVLPGTQYLFLAEGVLFYFEETQVKNLILTLRDAFPGCELVFDTLSPFLAWMSRLETHGLKGSGNLVRWALSRDKDLEQWGDEVRLLGRWGYFDQFEPRLGAASLGRIFPPFARGLRVLRYQLGASV